ncbi:MAG: class I SAM-dependent methyltransferase [Deltaproteobacteria bacterium]|nr:class I SAM-dependent methyltransferase [Deltaproteobacteria bacterium]
MSFLTQWVARRNGGMAVAFEKFTAPLERAGLAAIRARLAGTLYGRIIEIGCGTGLNFPHYTADAEVVAIEPMEDYRLFAAERAKTAAARITVAEGDAQALAFPDHSFDAGIETLAFCSVPDAAKGLRELRRVVKPGAPVRFFEHVRSEHAAVALVQDVANPLWRWLMDGCNLNRDTVAAIRAAGFTVEAVAVHDLRVPHTPRFPMREIQARA